MRHSLLLFVVAAVVTVLPLSSEVRAQTAPCPATLTDRIPARAASAVGGAAFIERLDRLPAAQREAAIVSEVLAGNVPTFLRRLKPVTLVRNDVPKDGQSVRAVICVMPDFLAIGSDQDFVRMPMDMPSAIRVAREFGFILPTPRMVRAIHTQSTHRFRPEPMTPGPQMASPDYYRTHNRRIRTQRDTDGVPLGALVAGHKKTIVLSNKLHDRPGRIAIFGWIRRDGSAIQPLSTVHGARYADYSHGVRLVSDVIMIGDKTYSLYDVLGDAKLSKYVTQSGRLENPRALMGWPPPQPGG